MTVPVTRWSRMTFQTSRQLPTRSLTGSSTITPMLSLLFSPFIELHTQLFQASVVNLLPAFMLFFSKQRVLTRAGLLHAAALGWGLWTFLGPAGWTMGVAYLLLGYVVTKIRMKEKEVCVWTVYG
ncbi:DUF92 domain-containing protein [archaeon]|nr:MAG: DUF92 domain-containing protein [archaeon]